MLFQPETVLLSTNVTFTNDLNLLNSSQQIIEAESQAVISYL